MAIPLKRQIDAESRVPIINAAPGTASGHVVTYEQLNAAIEGLAPKDNVRAASTVNVTVSAPGASMDSISLTSGDRILLKNQTAQAENGLYVWNGAATPATRTADASTFDEMESAIVTVDEGTSNAGTTWRQTQVNGVIGTNNIIWIAFGTAVSAASESSSGIAEIATQAETDAGSDDARIVTPLKLATYSGRAKRFSQDFGDGSATSYAITHNLGTLDVNVYVRETGGTKRAVLCEVQHTTTNQVTLLFDTAPASNAMRITVVG